MFYFISECQEKKDKQIESLQKALQVERSNFSRVSKVLSEERKVSGLTQSEQEAIIKVINLSYLVAFSHMLFIIFQDLLYAWKSLKFKEASTMQM